MLFVCLLSHPAVIASPVRHHPRVVFHRSAEEDAHRVVAEAEKSFTTAAMPEADLQLAQVAQTAVEHSVAWAAVTAALGSAAADPEAVV